MRAHFCAGSGRTPGATPKSNADTTQGNSTRVLRKPASFLCVYTSILRRSRAADLATKPMTSDRARRKSGKLCSPSQSELLINDMVNNDRHPRPPRLPVLTLPQACPPALGAFYRGMRVATAGLLGLCLPARRARSEMLRVGNNVSSFYGTQADQRGVGSLAMLAAMRACFGIVKLRGGVCYPAEFIRARAGPNRDHRCAINLGLLDRAAGVSGGMPPCQA